MENRFYKLEIKMKIRPITFKAACDFVTKYHRHHKRPVGHKFSISVVKNNEIIGVAIVGRPIARRLDNNLTAEITRLCIIEENKNAASFLLGAARKCAFAMGYEKIITYTMPQEGGASLRGAGFIQDGITPGKTWSVKTRKRTDKHPLGEKIRWVCKSR